jgi:predicted AlkP superfamily phosphohydrolase/phosphomutase
MLMARVMMIGLDAASLDFIDRSRASLPNLRRLLDVGVSQRLWSRSGELFPASVWPTFYTATQPGRHGVYYPLQWEHESMSLRATVDMLYCEPFWSELERRGYRVVALDVPATWRSRLQRGIEITDWATHDETQGFSVQPRELKREFRRRFGGRSIGPEIPVRKSRRQLSRLRDEVVRSAVRKGALVRWLAERQEWDFFITVFGETHRAGHLFWPVQAEAADRMRAPDGALLECYQAVDRAIGDIMQIGLDGKTVLVVFSVHGMGENRSQEHFTRAIMDRLNERFAARVGNHVLATTTSRPRSVMRVLRERLPARLQHAIGRAVPLGVRDAVVNRAFTSGYNWAQTPGLAILASVTGFLRFNLRGREKAGMLEPGSEVYRSYVRWVQEAFHSCRITDTGEALVNEVTLTSEEFAGERSVYLPDAVVSWADRRPTSRINSDELGAIIFEPPTGRAGNHRPEGFAIVIDPQRERGGQVAQGDIVDLVPMVWRLLNRPT